MCLFSLLFFVFLVVVFVLALCFWLLCFSRSPWNHIISVHYEPEAYYSIGFYCRIHTASKYLHNDLARAIRRWSKKNRTQNVLAQGQSEAHGDSKLCNTIVEVPVRLNLK